ncbi:bifunctional metallophosphatase/5'-nucleotidase [Rhodohalobacter sp.]|uniref:bifunctional metallophosphatase/5'-nucleotidase n=1 Tax=Rhodohalobacter sp. TaxID=1974210 RepID=UPI002ACE1CD3|nr:metallophosphoesterase [Rhodohalobacter sp.]MDZ7758509.1 metallophosphoesterase [Rhodohalobacter sp.]
MISRKDFLKKSAFLAAGAIAPIGIGSRLFGEIPSDLTILYTNDTHARLDPFPDNAVEFAGLGGIARRASLVKKIRSQSKNVLLLDAGDVFQGTPWFDVYGGEIDLKLMSEMGYDAMAVGNHEFDRGPDGFAEAAQKAEFPILAANYDASGTPMNSYLERLIVREFNGFRVGIFGLGIELDGVVSPELYGDVKHRDPIAWANGMKNSLIDYHKCDYIICLSHLGFRYNNGRMDDLTLAKKVAGIDLIIGAHTHTFLDYPVGVMNPEGGVTQVTQMGHGGVRLGRIDLNINSADQKVKTSDRFYVVGEKTGYL